MRKAALIFVIFCVFSAGIFHYNASRAQTASASYAASKFQPDLHSIAYSDHGLYAVVGKSGVILTSGGDSQWSMRKSGTRSSLWGIVWGDGQFVAVGENAVVLRSSDGIEWTPCTSDSNASLFDVAWNGKQYAAVGKDGTILISDDAVNWEKARMATGETLLSVEWSNGKYVAVGENEVVLTSDDGVTWDTAMAEPFSDRGFMDSAASDYNIVVVGDNSRILISDDAVNWEETGWAGRNGDDVHLSAITRGDGLFVAAGAGGTIITSIDGEMWNELSSGAWKSLRDVIWDGKCYIAVGDSGTVIMSSDGRDWRRLLIKP